jgi:hypothetical protein
LTQTGAPGTDYRTARMDLNILSRPFTLWTAHIHNPSLNGLKD